MHELSWVEMKTKKSDPTSFTTMYKGANKFKKRNVDGCIHWHFSNTAIRIKGMSMSRMDGDPQQHNNNINNDHSTDTTEYNSAAVQ